jgi:hypothetical protein
MKIVRAIWIAAGVLFAATLGADGASEPDAFWGTEDVAAFLGVPSASVRYWAYVGTGPRSYKIGRRRKYKPSDVREWAEAQVEQPAEPLAKAPKSTRQTGTRRRSNAKASGIKRVP